MKKLLLIILVLFVNNTKAQQWIDTGATWYYGFENFGIVGFYKVVYENDTMIAGKACQQLGTYRHNYYHVLPQNIYSYISTDTFSKFFTYSSNDTVYFQNEDFYPGFHVLINYNAQEGDSWSLGFNNDVFPCNDSLETVDSIGIITINSQQLRWQHLSNEFIHVFGLWGKVIERIGNVDHFLLPLSRGCDDGVVIEFDQITFRCFFDNTFPEYNATGQPCDFPISVGVSENEFIKTTLYPNPANNSATLEFENPTNTSFNFQIFDITGRVVMEQSAITTNRITLNTQHLPAGIYHYRLLAEEKKKQSFGKFVVE